VSSPYLTMLFSLPFSRPDDAPPVPAIVRNVMAQSLTWNRPVFKAPPLEVEPPIADVASFISEFAKPGRAERVSF
jgi:hypothetical protein